MAIVGVASAVLGVFVAPYIDRVTAQRALFWDPAFKVLIVGLAAVRGNRPVGCEPGEFDGIFDVIAAIDLVMLGLLVFFNLEKHKVRLNMIVGAQAA